MNKRVLITAGSTAMMIDKVRKISNIFQGRTGWNIAKYASNIGWNVTLLTSSPAITSPCIDNTCLKIMAYHSFDDLAALMQQEIRSGQYDAIIHSAAVSDYQPCALWQKESNNNNNNQNCQLIIIKIPTVKIGEAATKVSSGKDSIFLEMKPTIKLVDCIRQPWLFRGILVKFKLQVAISDNELLAIAEQSRRASKADLIVANCLEWATEYAYIINSQGEAEHVQRQLLASRLMDILTIRCL